VAERADGCRPDKKQQGAIERNGDGRWNGREKASRIRTTSALNEKLGDLKKNAI